MLCNLPEELQERKLQVVRDAITASFGTRPTTFRTGRWGYSGRVAHALHRTGYAVDSSLTPHVDCRRQHGQDFPEVDLHPYSFDPKRFLTPDPDGPMLEVPATIGFLGPTGRLARLSDLGPRHRTAQRRLIRSIESVLLSEAAAVIPGARHRVPAGPAPARAPEVARS